MAARLIYLDASPGVVHVRCQACGLVGSRVKVENAQAVADRHRAEQHPRQATFAASKRRARGTS